MEEVQLVISIIKDERPDAPPDTWIVKLGTRVAGSVSRIDDAWAWRRGDLEGEPCGRRIEAALALVEYAYEEVLDRDVLDYESKGLKVVLHGSKFLCTSCGQWVAGSQMGLRRIRGDLIRNQPQCSRCRSKKAV